MRSPEQQTPCPSELFEDLRRQEFKRLEATRQSYLDYTGAALFPETLVASHMQQLTRTVLGNPHSDNPSSLASAKLVHKARAHVLQFFEADPAQYEVIFVANATAAVKLVAESFPFCPSSQLLLTTDNHNSVNGIREYALRAGTQVSYWPLAQSLELCEEPAPLKQLGRMPGPNLFAFPAQSNFSGIQHNLDWINRAQRAGFAVLLDAAAFVPTNSLSLRRRKPEFVCLSFYKMFGYPTGIGALIARRDALVRLSRPWFSGGTVDFVSTHHNLHQLSNNAAGFEDGTANFGSMAAVIAGLDFLTRISYPRISSHTTDLMRQLVRLMGALSHSNGAPLVQWYGSRDARYGNTRAFNLLSASGAVIDYEEVERDAKRARISIRGGCFCNPGCAEAAFEMPPAATRACLQSLSGEAFEPRRLRACLGNVPVGALRVSVGIPTNQSDVSQFLGFLSRYVDGTSKEGKLQKEDDADYVYRKGTFAHSPAG